ncbi:hybrid sensor histidine kinase/response regulator [Chlorobaculum limnaeum]|uniref:histidine kinase n=2 Tax=Chlorobaculum limnaeum TaxID=274537 RepID=A0A1D8CVZ9_CHLLM|nr:hybrid sensor histidine kinase/response regulator [Chlorobaculum limnaeum]
MTPQPLPFDKALSSDSHIASSAMQDKATTHNTLAAITELYDAIPASVIIVDARMRLVGWNSFSRDTINGLTDHEMPDVNPLKRVHPDDLAEISRKARDIIHLDIEESGEFRMYHKNGPPYKWAMFRGKRAIIGGEPCVVAVVTEITELKQAEEGQQKLQKQLLQYQKMELVGQLAGGIAHDFNNTLAAIIGNTELALRKLNPADPATPNITDVHKLALRSAEMTRQLLAFARKQTATPQVFELNESVSECIHLHRSLIGNNIRIEWNPHGEPVQVKLDPMQLDQILSNLLINARDAITGCGCIRIGCETVRLAPGDCVADQAEFAPGTYAKLSITDNGCGIEEPVLPHIYEPFFTTKEVGKGTGLGLSTVYGIVMQQRGRIECRSECGAGTTFTVYLPLHLDERQTGDGAAKREKAALNAAETILVVDDEPFILKLIQEILESRDFTVFIARDASECLQIANGCARALDLLVTDIMLPDINGIEMSRLLRQKHPSMKLLFMSAHAPEQLALSRKEKNEVNFIQKPFGIGDFIEKIDRVLNMA